MGINNPKMEIKISFPLENLFITSENMTKKSNKKEVKSIKKEIPTQIPERKTLFLMEADS